MAQHGHMPTSKKAKEMLRHGKVKGHTLSGKQKGLFGLLAGGGKISKLAKKMREK